MDSAAVADKFNQLNPLVVEILKSPENLNTSQVIDLFPEQTNLHGNWQELADRHEEDETVSGRAFKALSLQCILTWYAGGGQGDLPHDLVRFRKMFKERNFSEPEVPHNEDPTDTYYYFIYGKYLLLHWKELDTTPVDFADDLIAIFDDLEDKIVGPKIRELETFNRECFSRVLNPGQQQAKHAIHNAVRNDEYSCDHLSSSTRCDQKSHGGMVDVLLKQRMREVKALSLTELANMLYSTPQDRASCVAQTTQHIATLSIPQEPAISVLFCSAFSCYHHYLRTEGTQTIGEQLTSDLSSCDLYWNNLLVPYDDRSNGRLGQIVYGCYLMAKLREESMPCDLLARIFSRFGGDNEGKRAHEFLVWYQKVKKQAFEVKRTYGENPPSIGESCEQWLQQWLGDTPLQCKTLLGLYGARLSQYWQSNGLSENMAFGGE